MTGPSLAGRLRAAPAVAVSPALAARPSGAGNNSGAQLRALIERVERLEAERRDLGEDIREIYAEAKGTGFKPRILRKIVRLRALDPDKRREDEALMETYLAALGME